MNTEKSFSKRCSVISALFASLLTPSAPIFAGEFKLEPGDKIAVVGNALAERLQNDGWFESYLQSALPEYKLQLRNLGYSGDQVHYRPRAHEGFGDSDSHLANVQASVIFSFFGYNESFADQPEDYRKQLSAWVDHVKALKYLPGKAPRLVLFSPIAHEDLDNALLPDGKENNRKLAEIAKVTEEVAKAKSVSYVDLFEASKEWYAANQEALTINGVHLNEKGNQTLASYLVEKVLKKTPNLDPESLEKLRAAVQEKDRHWFHRYRAASGNDVWGTRSIQDGNHETLNRELQQLEVMTANRDQQVWARAKGGDLKVDDKNVPSSVKVGTHIVRDVKFLSPEETAKSLTLPEELQINVFAAEDQFPEIVNPVALQVDTKGRIWVASWEDYPKWKPGTEVKDRLVILSDEDGDGKADKSKTFAHVSNLTGFEFWNGGVIAVAAPNVYFLKDTDGDDVADQTIHLFGGLGSDDTHHAANNIILGPDGYIYYQRGIFILENVETPWRVSEESGTTGLYRFNPRTFDFSYVVQNSPNPHGIAFDKWGSLLINDGTSGKAFQVYQDQQPASAPGGTIVDSFKSRPLVATTVRPVASSIILSSPHFPESYDNNYLILNTIGYQGIKQYSLEHLPNGAVEGKNESNLLFTGGDPTFKPNSEATPRVIPEGYTGDPNFRPTDAAIGFDGALYVSDWQNPVITHSPYNLRDTSRDRRHGRIYRVTAKGRPLMERPKVAGESVDHLLSLLRHPSGAIRHQARVELSAHPSEEVIKKTLAWAANLQPEKVEDAIPLLEALWAIQQHGGKDEALLKKAQTIVEPKAKPAVDLVAWHWSGRNTHFRGDVTKQERGMQFKTGYESFWTKLTGQGDAPKVTAVVQTVDLRDKPVAQITIQTTLLKFNVESFTVSPGQSVELTLDNVDIMPHNLIITSPGTIEEVSKKAMEMGVEGWGKHYNPATKDVLHATKLVDASKKEVLSFKAPEKPGDYPYVCTFPGHSFVMRGVMTVAEKK